MPVGKTNFIFKQHLLPGACKQTKKLPDMAIKISDSGLPQYVQESKPVIYG